MSGELAVLLFIGNAILFWLWISHLIPLLRSKLLEAPGDCPHCGRAGRSVPAARKAPRPVDQALAGSQ